MTAAWSPCAHQARRSRSAARASGVRMWIGSEASCRSISESGQKRWLMPPLASSTTRSSDSAIARPSAAPTAKKSSSRAVWQMLTETQRSPRFR